MGFEHGHVSIMGICIGFLSNKAYVSIQQRCETEPFATLHLTCFLSRKELVQMALNKVVLLCGVVLGICQAQSGLKTGLFVGPQGQVMNHSRTHKHKLAKIS